MHRFAGMYIPPLDWVAPRCEKGLLKDAIGGRALAFWTGVMSEVVAATTREAADF